MSKPATNSFFEADFSKFMDMTKMMDVSKLMDMSKMVDMSKMMDVSKIMNDFKMPNMNVDAIMAAYRRNIEAITSANQAAYENMQSFARRQAELMRQNFEATTSMVQAIIAAQTPEEKVSKQVEATKASMDRCVSSLKELTDMLAQNQYQAMEAVSARICEGLDEVQNLMKNGRASS